jgi:hypothetical protein
MGKFELSWLSLMLLLGCLLLKWLQIVGVKKAIEILSHLLSERES